MPVPTSDCFPGQTIYIPLSKYNTQLCIRHPAYFFVSFQKFLFQPLPGSALVTHAICNQNVQRS